tara:strand:+ start:839 stop:1669 length:831 start_codon:yes stop_codon:yes gene_type:complete
MNEETQVAEPTEASTTSSEATFDWKNEIPEEVRDNRVFETHKNLGSLLKSHAHQQALIGADKIPVPKSDASDDQWNEVYTRMGRPAEATEYKLDVQMPEGQKADDGLINWFRETSHKAGLNNRQAQAMLNEYQKVTQQQEGQNAGAIDQLREQGVNSIKQEYGAAFDDKLKVGNAAISQFEASDLTQLKLADGRTLGDHPDFIKAFVGVGDFIKNKIGEDSLEGAKTTGALSPDVARAKLAELKRANGPFWNKSDPEHTWTVQEALRLQELITPNE